MKAAAFLLPALLFSLAASRAQDNTPVDTSAFDDTVKLACVGDSITQGVGAKRGKSWPSQLQQMLGDKWKVENFGLSGATLMNSGNKPYQKTGHFKRAKASQYLLATPDDARERIAAHLELG